MLRSPPVRAKGDLYRNCSSRYRDTKILVTKTTSILVTNGKSELDTELMDKFITMNVA